MSSDNRDGAVSRATSVSRASKPGSSVSRAQSLIKKNVAPHDLKPSDILIERFVAWKAIVKQLIAYFEGVADIENNTARELTKLGAVIQVPFRTGNQFLGEGGIQDIFYGIRDKTRIIADEHASLGKSIDSSIVQHLQKLRVEIKAHIKNVQNDTGKLATSVAREREMSTKLVADLAKSISSFKNTPMHVTSKDDPYVANLASEEMDRSGPIAAAVRSAGYLSDDDDEMEGSSVEEEEDDDLYHQAQEAVHDDGDLPSYPVKGNVDLGPFGYTNEKGVRAHDFAGEGNGRLSRRPSKRQQEKAPAIRSPDRRPSPGPAPIESKFTEVI